MERVPGKATIHRPRTMSVGPTGTGEAAAAPAEGEVAATDLAAAGPEVSMPIGKEPCRCHEKNLDAEKLYRCAHHFSRSGLCFRGGRRFRSNHGFGRAPAFGTACAFKAAFGFEAARTFC